MDIANAYWGARDTARSQIDADLARDWPTIKETILESFAKNRFKVGVRNPGYAQPAWTRYYIGQIEMLLIAQGLPSTRKIVDIKPTATGFIELDFDIF